MKSLNIKKTSLKNISIECHAEALPAFMIEKDYKYQYQQLDFSKDIIQLLQGFNPLHVIQVSRNEYKFFSGWFWLSYCRHLNCDKITIIVHSEMEQYDIQQAAWSYLLSNQFQTFHRRNNLAQLSHYLDSMPDHYKISLLSSMGTSSSQVMIQKLSNESRSAVRNQKKHLDNSDPPTNKLSIREQLTKGSKNIT